jgi:predicted DNA-binding transcriptional regulator AlpA
MPEPTENNFSLDHVHRWPDWCALVGISTTTAWRLCKHGDGPIVTNLTSKLRGVRHRHHLAWLTAREQHNTEAA